MLGVVLGQLPLGQLHEGQLARQPRHQDVGRAEAEAGAQSITQPRSTKLEGAQDTPAGEAGSAGLGAAQVWNL